MNGPALLTWTKPRVNHARTLALALTLAALTGCSPAVDRADELPALEAARHSTPPGAWRPKQFLPPQKMTAEEAAARRASLLAEQARHWGLKDPATPALIRWVTYDEGIEVMGRCLEERGVQLNWEADRRSFEVKTVGEQTGPLGLADYECLAQYTPDPRQDLRNEATLGIMWEYNAEYVIPCLKEHGFPVLADLPSREVFIAGNGGWQGFPLDDSAAIAACRPSPPSEALLGGSY